MGDATGFKKVKRSIPKTKSVESRLKNFDEFYKPSSVKHTKDQASRCMDCGIPFCHSGCPLGNKIPDFNDAVYKGDWKKAYELLVSTNNFPEFTGRICPAPCEGSCVLGINNDAVSIEYIEKSIVERAFREGWVKPQSAVNKSDKKIAIIGSGPAGLATADELSKKGHHVTVFERKDRIGGLLRYGIPDFKLAKNVVDRRINLMRDSGVEFRTNVNVGFDISMEELRGEYDAVVLCGGATMPRDLPIPGRQLKGIHLAMEFLEQNNRRVQKDPIESEGEIEVNREHIVVIGGGDTGSDCIGTSNRLGAKSVTQIELLSKPPKSRTTDNPWPLWPQILRTSSSHEEGCTRDWSILTKRFLSEDGIHLSGLEVVKIEWSNDEDGKHKMKEIEGSKEVIPCTKVFLAIGFLHGEKKGLISDLNLKLDTNGNVLTDNFQTSVPDIFAAGDIRRGQSLVVWAIDEGRKCARAVHEHLETVDFNAFLNEMSYFL